MAGVIKAWHIHQTITVNDAVLAGRAKLVMYDLREDSPIMGALQEVLFGEDNHVLVQIPPGIANGYKAYGDRMVIMANGAINPTSRRDAPHVAGPIYTFYTPYHLCHLEVPFTVARTALFGDAVVAPDAIGFYLTYGVCENADVTRRRRLLPMGLSEGCVLTRNIGKDTRITYDDVELPVGRLIDKLRAEQTAMEVV